MKINILTVGLVIGFIALGGYYFWEQSRPPVTSTDNVIWNIGEGLAPASQSSVSLTSESQSVIFQKRGKEWRMVNHPDRPLDYRWESGYSSLARLAYERKLADEANPKDYGLDRPCLTVALDQSHRLLIGSQNPTKSGYYAMVAGQKPLYLLGSWQVNAWKELVSNPPFANPTAKPPVSSPVATHS